MNKAQQHHLELMKLASFNEFDGERVVQSLMDNISLWKSAVMVCDAYPLIPLREIWQGNNYHVDTLYILADGDKMDKLELLVHKNFGADEVSWLDDKEARMMMGGGDGYVLRVWWD